MKVHPAATIFPLLEGPEFEALKADIKEHGQRVACVLWRDGSLLDGRNRWRACEAVGRAPRTETWDGDDPVAFVVSTNLKRRHLTQSQAAMCATDALPLLEEEAEKRQKAAGARGAEGGRGKAKPSPQSNGKGSKHAGESTTKAAALFGTSGRYVSDAKAIKEHSVELAEEVRRGTKTIPDAKREIKREEHAAKVEKAKASPPKPATEPPCVIVADPPWRYDDATPNREVENQYPTATVEDICAMAPKTQKDAVLFLWATAPKLLEALRVMEAWGFLYRTHAIWDKGTCGMGYWFRGQHELLLVGVKGKFSPPPESDRVRSVLRYPRGSHSEKPDQVYEMIRFAWPDASRLEMFARAEREGWAVSGNEV